MASKYISRSAYQKLIEENKRLLRDLQIICYYKNEEELMIANQIMDKWHDHFHEKDRFKSRYMGKHCTYR